YAYNMGIIHQQIVNEEKTRTVCSQNVAWEKKDINQNTSKTKKMAAWTTYAVYKRNAAGACESDVVTFYSGTDIDRGNLNTEIGKLVANSPSQGGAVFCASHQPDVSCNWCAVSNTNGVPDTIPTRNQSGGSWGSPGFYNVL